MDELAYTVDSPLEHDGVRYAVGESVELPAATGDALVRCGALLPLAEGAPEVAEPEDAPTTSRATRKRAG